MSLYDYLHVNHVNELTEEQLLEEINYFKEYSAYCCEEGLGISSKERIWFQACCDEVFLRNWGFYFYPR
jgi:hypothetical protein